MSTNVTQDQVKEALLAKNAATIAINKARRSAPTAVKTPEVSQGIWVSILFFTALVFGAGLATGVGYNSGIRIEN